MTKLQELYQSIGAIVEMNDGIAFYFIQTAKYYNKILHLAQFRSFIWRNSVPSFGAIPFLHLAEFYITNVDGQWCTKDSCNSCSIERDVIIRLTTHPYCTNVDGRWICGYTILPVASSVSRYS